MSVSKSLWQKRSVINVILNKTFLSKSIFVPGPYNSGAIRNMSAGEHGIPLQQIVKELNDFANLKWAESWDNVGLLIEPTTPVSVKTVLLTNDLTEPVMEEALSLGTNLIISYHPPIFSALKRITTATWKERIVASCLENKIAVYSPHTSWDATFGGVGDWLTTAFSNTFKESEREPIIPSDGLSEYYTADVIGPDRQIQQIIDDLSSRGIRYFGVQNTAIVDGKKMYKITGCTKRDIAPFLDIQDTSVSITKQEMKKSKTLGMGRIIYTKNITLRDCVTRLKKHVGLNHIRLALGIKKTEDSAVNKIAFVPGSGGTLLRGVDADLYVTGEMFHHDILDANHRGTSVILLNHSDSERGFLKTMKSKLQVTLPGVDFIVSATDRDPITTV